MAYTAEINRKNPALIVLLIDQSLSMKDSVAGSDQPNRKKSEALATALNRMFFNLVLRCQEGEEIKHFFDIALLGYGEKVGPAFAGPLAGREIVSVTDLGNQPADIEQKMKRVDDGAGGIHEQQVEFPVWIYPVSKGGTPMCEVFSRAHELVAHWVSQHANSFPPIVIHITDGESTDGDPLPAMKKLTSLASPDGNVLLFNIHIASSALEKSEQFPASSERLAEDPSAQALFAGSSVLPEFILSTAKTAHKMSLAAGARGYVYNGDMVLVIQALDIGTRPANMR